MVKGKHLAHTDTLTAKGCVRKRQVFLSWKWIPASYCLSWWCWVLCLKAGTPGFLCFLGCGGLFKTCVFWREHFHGYTHLFFHPWKNKSKWNAPVPGSLLHRCLSICPHMKLGSKFRFYDLFPPVPLLSEARLRLAN